MAPRAQRLSASLRTTPAGEQALATAYWCAQRLSASLRTTPPGCPRLPGTPACAQRLSASLRTTPRTARGAAAFPPVLNAFRHHCGQHSGVPIRAGVPDGVLNAFRHHCGQHGKSVTSSATLSGCSTPFGITADNTGSPTRRPSATRGAQRLSASLRTTRVTPASPRAHRSACSTPFGITADNTTRGPVPRSRPGRVLNAFRHHCGQHGRPGSFSRRCSAGAQRLSASLRTTRPGRWPLRPSMACSTPFGITADNTLRVSRGNGLGQLCSTPFGITADNTPSAPTPRRPRASSAQRLSASLRTTPAGWRRPRRPGRVLNAFRHHCGQHMARQTGRYGTLSCAQRLSASLRTTRGRGAEGAADHGCAQRLSASLRTTLDLCRRAFARVEGAQRLSASLRTTRHLHVRPPAVRPVLNAFRHHCGQHFHCSRGSTGVFGCSTPFGITADNTWM